MTPFEITYTNKILHHIEPAPKANQLERITRYANRLNAQRTDACLFPIIKACNQMIAELTLANDFSYRLLEQLSTLTLWLRFLDTLCDPLLTLSEFQSIPDKSRLYQTLSSEQFWIFNLSNLSTELTEWIYTGHASSSLIYYKNQVERDIQHIEASYDITPYMVDTASDVVLQTLICHTKHLK